MKPTDPQWIEAVSAAREWLSQVRLAPRYYEEALAALFIQREAEARRLLSESQRVLGIARDRSVKLGNCVMELGGVDINRGQFVSLCDRTDESIRTFLSGEGSDSMKGEK